jgi:EamA domain-containing membrane protein RarD
MDASRRIATKTTKTAPMSHSRAASLMILVAFLWSIAGVVARHLDAAQSFEVTFWRSLFNAAALTVALTAIRGARLWRDLAGASRSLWFSGCCWAVMFTAFMIAITLTTVANVLVTMAIAPLITALFSRVFLKHRLPVRTWSAIAIRRTGDRLDVQPRSTNRGIPPWHVRCVGCTAGRSHELDIVATYQPVRDSDTRSCR